MKTFILHGCSGYMGKVVRSIVDTDSDAEIVAGIDPRPDGSADFPVYASFRECKETADAIIDFSTASAVDEMVDFGLEKKIPMVICTTGLSDEQLQKISEASKEVAILRSANMSLGINTLMKLISEAAQILKPAGFDIEILEMHHKRKLDAPSGPALALADCVNEALDNSMDYTFDRSSRRLQRPENEIGISALRGGSVVGEHEVIFAGQDEVIKITHSAYSRNIFAKGAVSAAKFLAGKEPGMYDMSDVIG